MDDPDDTLGKVPRRFVLSIWKEPSNDNGLVRGRIFSADPEARDARRNDGDISNAEGFQGFDGIAVALRRLLRAAR